MSGWGGRRVTEMRRRVFGAMGRVCHLCGLPGADTIDHLVPRAAGGDDSLDNLRPAHGDCNALRQDMPLTEWFRRHPLPSRAEASRPW
ncbi:HNH endonuclease [Corynebacterium kalidii]